MVVEFTIGGSTFSAQVTGITSTAITAKAPAVPNSVMSSESCDVDNDGTAGTRYIATAATVKVSSPITGCTDDFAGAFLYTPSSTHLRRRLRPSGPGRSTSGPGAVRRALSASGLDGRAGRSVYFPR